MADKYTVIQCLGCTPLKFTHHCLLRPIPGKPKAVLHTTAGYAVGAAATFKYVFDYKPSDIYWCTADCGWITGHSYVTYGPLFSCASQVRWGLHTKARYDGLDAVLKLD